MYKYEVFLTQFLGLVDLSLKYIGVDTRNFSCIEEDNIHGS